MIETIYSNPDVLYHYGVKGMKWGVRKDEEEIRKSKKQQTLDKFYQQYKDAGYSDKDAMTAAKGRLAFRNGLIVAGSVAAAAAAAYGVYKYRDYAKDRILSADHILQTVHEGLPENRVGTGRAIYATYGKVDGAIYSSKLFSHFTDQSNVTKFYNEDGLKVASEKSARKVYEDLLANDKSFLNDVSRFRSGSLIKGKEGYRRFNKGLVYSTGKDKLINEKFYNALRAKGYGAVLDMNDKHIEGWTFNPMIVFDNDTNSRVLSSKPASNYDLSAKKEQRATIYATVASVLNKPLNPVTVELGAIYGAAVGMYAADGIKLKKTGQEE